MNRKSADAVGSTLTEKLKLAAIPALAATPDNGKEFTDHKRVAKNSPRISISPDPIVTANAG